MIKERSIPLCVIFTIITCGLYGIYWFVCLTDDMNEAADDYTTSGILALVLRFVTCGLYGLYWAYKMGDKLDKIKSTHGLPSSNGGILYLIVFMFFPLVAYALLQNELNKMAY